MKSTSRPHASPLISSCSARLSHRVKWSSHSSESAPYNTGVSVSGCFFIDSFRFQCSWSLNTEFSVRCGKKKKRKSQISFYFSTLFLTPCISSSETDGTGRSDTCTLHQSEGGCRYLYMMKFKAKTERQLIFRWCWTWTKVNTLMEADVGLG